MTQANGSTVERAGVTMDQKINSYGLRILQKTILWADQARFGGVVLKDELAPLDSRSEEEDRPEQDGHSPPQAESSHLRVFDSALGEHDGEA